MENGRQASEAPSSSSSDFYGQKTSTHSASTVQQQMQAIPAHPAAALRSAPDSLDMLELALEHDQTEVARSVQVGQPGVLDATQVSRKSQATTVNVTQTYKAVIDDTDSSSEMDMSIESGSESSPELAEVEMQVTQNTKRKASVDESNDPTVKKMKADAALAQQTTQKPTQWALSAPNQQVPPAQAQHPTAVQVQQQSTTHVFASTAPVPPPTVGLPAQIWQRIFLLLSPATLARCLSVNKAFKHYLTAVTAAKQLPKVGKTGPVVPAVLPSNVIWRQSRMLHYPGLPSPLHNFLEFEMLQLIGGRTCQFCNRKLSNQPAMNLFTAGPGLDGLRVVWSFGIRTCGKCLDAVTVKDIEILVSPAAPLRQGLTYAFRTPEMHIVPEYTRQLPGGIPAGMRVAKVYYEPDAGRILAELNDTQHYGNGAVDEWRKGLVDRGKNFMAHAARWEKWETQFPLGTSTAQILREYELSLYTRDVETAQSKSASVDGAQSLIHASDNHSLPQPIHLPQYNGYAHQQPAAFQSQPASRQQRNALDAEEGRAARKREIERRCKAECEPPLTPDVLQYMSAFRAAIQITTPLTEMAWEILKPRILAQREYGEAIHYERSLQLAALQAANPSTTIERHDYKPSKETLDPDYEMAQWPLRKKLTDYAEEFITAQWRGGHLVDHNSAPIFAAEVLRHVHGRYLEDRQLEEPSRNQDIEMPNPAPEPFLSLDNMKFIFESKVKPISDRVRRDLFICSGCEDVVPKWFAFEGLIQHYGAKHTSDFSEGNIVVQWQNSEWPEVSPFHINPAKWSRPALRRDPKHRNNNGRASAHTPRNENERHYQTPGDNAVLLSQNPLFSGDVQSEAAQPAQARYDYPQNNEQSVHYYAPPQPQAAPYEVQLNELATVARRVWDKTEGVKQLLDCIRIQMMVNHIVAHFLDKLHIKLELDMLTDTLATHALTRPIKSATGLACKICVTKNIALSAPADTYYRRIHGAKLYNISSLITHFKIQHAARDLALLRLDWVQDMIEIPEVPVIRDLVNAPGMDDEKLAIFAEAFPSAFPSPLPRIDSIKDLAEPVDLGSGLASRIVQRSLNKQLKPKRKSGINGKQDEREDSNESLPEPAADEYDPRRPIFAKPQHAESQEDLSPFDIDHARKSSTMPAPKTTQLPFQLAPETLQALEALKNLNAFSVQTNSLLPKQNQRSPSVGRHRGPIVSQATSGHNPPQERRYQRMALDVASPEPVAVPATALRPAIIAFNGVQEGPYAHQSPSYDQGRLPYVSSDLQAALHAIENAGASSHTTEPVYAAPVPQPPRIYRQHSRNISSDASELPRSGYEQRAYSQAPPHPVSRSPPRYRVIYDDDQPAPIYYDPPAQYVTRHQPPPVEYHYEQRAPTTIYVDEYGRQIELVPVDQPAPAPTSYAQPYEPEYPQRTYEGYSAPLSYQSQMQGVHEERRPVYYDQPSMPAARLPGQYAYAEHGTDGVPRT